MASSRRTGNLERDRIAIGTRGSPLALAQAELVRQALIAADPNLAAPGRLTVFPIKTTGDRIQDRALSEIGGKSLFTKEIEDALLAGAIDIAVHSMKDVPTQLPEGLDIPALLARADPADALIAAPGIKRLADLPPGAILGTSSLRRQAQALALRPDLVIRPLRGNVGTRLAKIAAGEASASLLAMAGLQRLGRTDAIAARLAVEEMLPAVAQGAIGIQCRAADRRMMDFLSGLDHAPTRFAITAERACLAELEGSCRTPIAAYAELAPAAANLRLRALIAKPDGRECHRLDQSAPVGDAAALGREIGRRLKAAAGPDFLRGSL